jgi:hypothetical protein
MLAELDWKLNLHDIFKSLRSSGSTPTTGPDATSPISTLNPSSFGVGIRVRGGKHVYFGRGATKPEKKQKVERFYFNKYYVDLKKLKNNILCVKYAMNDAHIPTVKVQNVSNDVKEMVLDILNKKYDERLFKKLSEADKRVIKRFVKATKLDDEIVVDDELDNDFQRQYEILLGELNSGNTSQLVKDQLKRYVIEGLQENKLPRHQAYLLLYQLSL